MIWLALLVLALLGFNRPRRALGRKLQEAGDDLLKLLVFIGVALFIIFGLLGAGLAENFFVALLPAAGIWLGVLAGIEQQRRMRRSKEDDLVESIRVDPVWQQRRQQRREEQPSRLFSDDPWGVIAAQRGAGGKPSSRTPELFNRFETEPEPVVARTEAEPDNGALLIYGVPGAPEADDPPRTQAAAGPQEDAVDSTEDTTGIPRLELVSVLKQHADRVDGEQALSVPEKTQKEPAAAPLEPVEETAEAERPAEDPAATPEPVPGQGAEGWLREESPAMEVDPKIDKHKQELEARPIDAGRGRYKYRPKLVKSLFDSDTE